MVVFIATVGSFLIDNELEFNLLLRIIVFLVFGVGIAGFTSQLFLKKYAFSYHIVASLIVCVTSYTIFSFASKAIEDGKKRRMRIEREELRLKEEQKRELEEQKLAEEREAYRRQKEIERKELQEKQAVVRKKRFEKYQKDLAEYNKYLKLKKEQDELRERLFEAAKKLSSADINKIESLDGTKLSSTRYNKYTASASIRLKHDLKHPIKNLVFKIYIFDSRGKLHDTIDVNSPSYSRVRPSENQTISLNYIKLAKDLPSGYKWNYKIISGLYDLPKDYKKTLVEELPRKSRPFYPY